MASERLMAHDGNVIDDTTFATGDNNSHHMHTTTMGTHEHTDEVLSTTGGDNKISAPPPAAASTYYTSFNEEAEYNTSIIDSTQVVNQPPPPAATTNNNNSASKSASIEYEQLLSSTIISLFQKFLPALHQRLSSSSDNNNNNNDETNRSELALQSSRSLEFADGYSGNYKTTGLDNNDDDDDNDAVLDVESQSFGAASSPYHPSERISTATTPKVSNLKTTGLLDSSDTIDNDECIHNYTNYHHHHHQSHQHQQHHQLQRQHSNSSTDYLPQSAAVLLNTLQHTNFDRGAEEILSSILRSGGSSSFDDGDTNDVREVGGGGEGSGELVVDGNHDGVAVNADGSMSKKKKPPAATINTQDAATKSTNNSFEQQSQQQQQQQQQHNYDDDDDNSISGDMARLSKSIAHLQRDLDNIDMSRFDGMVDMEQQQQQDLLDGGGGSRGNGWKRWIRNWLLSHGIIEDEKMVNSLLSNDDERGEGDDDGSIITPGRGGFTIFDFERDYVLVLTLLLVFFVLLRNRFKTMNELMFEEDNQDLEGLLGGSDW
eukprot:CAMPEP_0113396916 /NCGR_PEP_ID=MMETSP0013_2-20120614/14074_1 /TAXON_ID=2843 ORGANISM="Skeletonema costatum, Strain 1716" /NCGR_SAMPLE_ID=MMETSP0013_2 /ASSEMBLY_ACC=CAM_ASM_000158 /LENGTH=543 /DNA_ID=CAMNT_0000281409 /DNA_START=24 /DNA_END=1655 /DNA_ORIENTATION=- /assembly_acc=CAM_ASM_000158